MNSFSLGSLLKSRAFLIVIGSLCLILAGSTYFHAHESRTPFKQSIDALTSDEVRNTTTLRQVAAKHILAGMPESEALEFLGKEGFEVGFRSNAGWDGRKYTKLIVAWDKRPTLMPLISREIRILLGIEDEKVAGWEVLYFTWP